MSKSSRQILKKIEESEYPRINAFINMLKGMAKKNVLLFQFAFGMVTFGMAVGLTLGLEGLRFDEISFAKVIFWLILLGVYILTIFLEHWKEKLELLNATDTKSMNQFDLFLGNFRGWLYTHAEKMEPEKAVDFFEKGMKIFSVISAPTIDKKLTQVMLMMNDMVFSTSQQLKGGATGIIKAVKTPKTPIAPTPKIEVKAKVESVVNTKSEDVDKIIEEALGEEPNPSV